MRSTVSHPYIPPIPGSDGKHVVTDRDVLGGEATVAPNVALVDGEPLDGWPLPRAQGPSPRALRSGRLHRSAWRPPGDHRRHPSGTGDLTATSCCLTNPTGMQ